MFRACATLARLIPILWLGAGLAISLIAIPVVFSPPIKAALPAAEVGHVAQSILGRFFLVQLGLLSVGLIARWGTGVSWTHWERFTWSVLAAGSLAAAFWLHPTLRELHRIKYDSTRPATEQAVAAHEFGRWHGLSQVGNLGLLILLTSLVIRAPGPLRQTKA